MKALTNRQQEVLSFLVDWTSENASPPSVREIKDGLGIKHPNQVQGILVALEKKRFIARKLGKHRSISVLREKDVSRETFLLNKRTAK